MCDGSTGYEGKLDAGAYNDLEPLPEERPGSPEEGRRAKK